MELEVRILVKNAQGVTRQAEYRTMVEAIERVEKEEMAGGDIRGVSWRNPETGEWEPVPLDLEDSTIRQLMEFRPQVGE